MLACVRTCVQSSCGGSLYQITQLTSHGNCHLGILRSRSAESHLTELEHLAENRAVFPYIKHLHLLHHLVLQKRTRQGVM